MNYLVGAVLVLLALGAGYGAGISRGTWFIPVGKDGTAFIEPPEWWSGDNRAWVGRKDLARLTDKQLFDRYVGRLASDDHRGLIAGDRENKRFRTDAPRQFGQKVFLTFVDGAQPLLAGVCEGYAYTVTLQDSFVVPVGWRLKPVEREVRRVYLFSNLGPGAPLPQLDAACSNLTDGRHFMAGSPLAAVRAAPVMAWLSGARGLDAPGIEIHCEDRRNGSTRACDAHATLETIRKFEFTFASTDITRLSDGGVQFDDTLQFVQAGDEDYPETADVTVTSLQPAAGSSGQRLVSIAFTLGISD